MAKMGKVAWGINIGNCNLKAIKLRSSGGGVEVQDFAVIEHEKILSQPEITPEERVDLIRAALTRFMEEHDLRGSTVVVSIPGQNSFARFIKLPPVEKKRVEDIVKFEAIQQIPFDIKEVEWDWQLFENANNPELEVGIFAIKRDLVRIALTPFQAAQCPVHMVQMTPMALYNFLQYDQKRPSETTAKQATVALEIGSENTELVIADGQRVWQRSIPIGGNHFTSAIQKAFKLSFAKAEEIKRTANTSKYARQIFQAMRTVFADLAAEIQRSLGYYSSGSREVQFREVLALGNAMKLPGLMKFLQQSLSLPVKRLENFESSKVAPDVSIAQFTENVPNFGVVYGLALQGLGLAAIEGNLLPREIARASLWRGKRPWFAAAGVILLLAPLLLVGSAMRVRSDITSTDTVSNLSRIETTSSIISKTSTAKSQATNAINTAMNSIKAPAKIYESRNLVPQALQTIRECLPNKVNTPDQANLFEAYQAGNLDSVRSIPRHQRKQIFLNTIMLIYTDDITQPFDTVLQAWKSGSKGRSLGTTATAAAGATDMGGMGGMPGMPGMPGMGMPGMPGMPGMGMPGPGGPSPAGPKSAGPGGKGGKTATAATKQATAPGFVVLLEGTTPNKGNLAFLLGQTAGSNQMEGFFVRLQNIGKTPTDGQGNAAASLVDSLPVEIYTVPDESIETYFDYRDGGWLASGTLAKVDQPTIYGILAQEESRGNKPVGPGAMAGMPGMGPGMGGAGNRIDSLPVYLDPYTLEPMSMELQRNANGEVMRDAGGKIETKENDYWFRVKFKLRLKGEAASTPAAAPGAGVKKKPGPGGPKK